jgi:hypothetical protein
VRGTAPRDTVESPYPPAAAAEMDTAAGPSIHAHVAPSMDTIRPSLRPHRPSSRGPVPRPRGGCKPNRSRLVPPHSRSIATVGMTRRRRRRPVRIPVAACFAPSASPVSRRASRWPHRRSCRYRFTCGASGSSSRRPTPRARSASSWPRPRAARPPGSEPSKPPRFRGTVPAR